eukprot:gene2093-1273_t
MLPDAGTLQPEPTIAGDDLSDAELLTGEELYQYLHQQQQQRKTSLEGRLHEYGELMGTLDTLLTRSRHRLLAPVAGGLGYFSAELNETNKILVLLGDGWFVERSVSQAKAIAERRRDFLRRESTVLAEEIRLLREKTAMFRQEVVPAPKGSDTIGTAPMAAVNPAPSAPPPPPSSSPAASLPVSGPSETAAEAAALPSGFTSLTPEELRVLSQLTGESVAALCTITEADELGEEELADLEDTLLTDKGADEAAQLLEDDGYMEKLLTDAVMRKKERHLRSRLQQCLAGQSKAPPSAPPEPKEAAPQAWKDREDPEKKQNTKRVSFAPDVADREAPAAAPRSFVPAGTTAFAHPGCIGPVFERGGPSAAASLPPTDRHSPTVSSQALPPQNQEATQTLGQRDTAAGAVGKQQSSTTTRVELGDVRERPTPEGLAPLAGAPAAAPAAQVKKRKSLFLSEQLGEE